MRPGSRGNLGTSAGAPPGTGFRPGSGRKAPGSARLRTGMAPSGTGTMAAEGMAINAVVNVSERPVTGQGVMGMKAKGHSTGRIVQDAAFYIGLLRKRISDVNSETIRLRTEIDQQSRDNTQYQQLERRYEGLSKSKEALEGQLADYNLALDKTRTSTDPEDVYQMSVHMAEKNRQTGQDLDRIFMSRKQREAETAQIEDQIDSMHREIQARINELEPGKLRAYNELLSRQKDLQDRVLQGENRLNEVNAHVRHFESDDKNNSLRKEYLNLEKATQSLKKEADSLQEELEIASMDPKEAHTQFVARVNGFKNGTKQLDERVKQLREEISVMRKNYDDLDSITEIDSGEAAKYDMLVKRDQEMSAFMDSFDDQRNAIKQDQQKVQFMIVALLEHISKGLDEQNNLPDQDTHLEMQDARQFKEKNLATAQRTMESLLLERKKREKELESLRSSEPKLIQELSALKESMKTMRSEMTQFQDVDRMRRDFDNTQLKLTDLKQTYIKRRDTIRQQIQSISAEHEGLKKALAANDIARDIEETEKRLKHYERTIFELKEFVDSKSRETDYEGVKASCLGLLDQLNKYHIQQNQMTSSQAKGSW